MSRNAIIILTLLAGGALVLVIGVFTRQPSTQLPAVVPTEPASKAFAPQPTDASATSMVQAPHAAPRLPSAVPHLRVAQTPAQGTYPTEAALMVKLHELKETDPPLTLQLARDGNARYPDSADAPERAWMVVKAIVNMQNFDEARAEARVMVKRYPGTFWSRDVERHLLVLPPGVPAPSGESP